MVKQSGVVQPTANQTGAPANCHHPKMFNLFKTADCRMFKLFPIESEDQMKAIFCSALVVVFCLALLAAAPAPRSDDKEKMLKPQYDAKGQLQRPADYRDWMFL